MLRLPVSCVVGMYFRVPLGCSSDTTLLCLPAKREVGMNLTAVESVAVPVVVVRRPFTRARQMSAV